MPTLKSKYGDDGRFIKVDQLTTIDVKYVGSSTGKTGTKYHNFITEDKTMLEKAKTNPYFKGVEIRNAGGVTGVRIGIIAEDARAKKVAITKTIKVI